MSHGATLVPLRRASAAGGERCDLCGASLGPAHPHRLVVGTLAIVCACERCDARGDEATRRIPRRVRLLGQFNVAAWERLGLPVDLVFVVIREGDGAAVARYPSVAGIVESTIDAEAWRAFVAAVPEMATLRPEVEGLIARRPSVMRAAGDPQGDWVTAPIDRCFALAGLVRSQWRGFSGGEGLWRAVDDFFAELRREATQQSDAAN